MSHQQIESTCSCGGVSSCYCQLYSCDDTNNHNLTTSKTVSNCGSLSNSQHASEQLRQDLARTLDRRIAEFGGSIRTDWEAIKRFAESQIQANIGSVVKADVERLLVHPELQELIRRVQHDRNNPEKRADVLDKMTNTILPTIRRSHRQFLDGLNEQVSQMIVRLMKNDQLAAVIDDENLMSHLFRLAASEDEQSSQKT